MMLLRPLASSRSLTSSLHRLSQVEEQGYSNDVAYLRENQVEVEYQNKGIGKKLMALAEQCTLEKISLEESSRTMLLTVDKCNKGAIRLYRREGYEVSVTTPEEAGYYIMRKKLTPRIEEPRLLTDKDLEFITPAALSTFCTDRGGGDAAAPSQFEKTGKLESVQLLIGRRAIAHSCPISVRINVGYTADVPKVTPRIEHLPPSSALCPSLSCNAALHCSSSHPQPRT